MKGSLRKTIIGLTLVCLLLFSVALGGYFLTVLYQQAIRSSDQVATLLLERNRGKLVALIAEVEQTFTSFSELADQYSYGLMFSNFDELKASLKSKQESQSQLLKKQIFTLLAITDSELTLQLQESSKEPLSESQVKQLLESRDTSKSVYWSKAYNQYVYIQKLETEEEELGYILALLNPELLETLRIQFQEDLSANGLAQNQAWFLSKGELSNNSPVSKLVDTRKDLKEVNFQKAGEMYVLASMVKMPDSSDSLLGASIPNQVIMSPIYQSFSTSLMIVALLFVVVVLFQSSAFLKWILQPLQTLKAGADEMAAGNLSHRIQLQSKNEIGALARSFNLMSESIEQGQNRLKEFNASLSDMVNAKTESIQNLLDNTGQGFLTFDKSFEIQPEFSQECRRIFGDQFIAGRKVTEFLFEVEEERNNFIEWMENAFEGTIDFDVIKSLSPAEVKVNRSTFSIEYNLLSNALGNQFVMLILTDITTQLKLERKILKEQSFAKMLLRILESPDQFVALVKDADKVLTNCENLSSGSFTEEEFDESFRRIHTVKGNAGFFELHEIVSSLHNIESLLQESGSKNIDFEELKALVAKYVKALNSLKDIVQTTLKEAINLDGRQVKIPEVEFVDLLKLIRDKEEKLYLKLSTYIQRPFRELFAPFLPMVDQIAKKQGKELHPIEIEGGDFLTDTSDYQEVIRTFVHLFRNAVDHGIEDYEVREEIGKDPAGRIAINISRKEDNINIEISDDGQGIDPEKIQRSVQEKGLALPKKVADMTREDWYDCLFIPGFSSASQVSEISGRGVGLDAVKHAIESRKGTIKVASETGNGSTFHVSIPYKY